MTLIDESATTLARLRVILQRLSPDELRLVLRVAEALAEEPAKKSGT
ncbi:hypothetical protein ES703_93901 [subsurface metagenome]